MPEELMVSSGESSEDTDDNEVNSDENLKSARKRQPATDPNGSNKKLKTKNELYKPPTTEELNHLKETESLYNSNLFRLQIEELLREINVREKRLKQVELWWDNFQQFVENLQQQDDINFDEIAEKKDAKKLTEREKFINELCSEKIAFKPNQNINIKFHKPDSVNLFGAYQLNVAIKTDLHINISIKMPASCFREKDYLNGRYFLKRHFYLIYIFNELKKKVVMYKEVSILYCGGSELMPYIRVIPFFCETMTINIFITGSENCFKLSRFLPEKNNVKISIQEEFHDVNSFESVGTSLYNSVLAKDITRHLNYTYMKSALNLKNVQDGIKLLTVWLTQRELNKGFGNFSSDIIFYVVAYLISRKKINQYMSSYQIVRIFWTFLCNTNWHEDPISIAEDVKDETLKSYKDNYDVTFLDSSGYFNVTSFVNLDVYLKVQSEARLALHILDNNKFDSFNSLFIARLPFPLQYDAILKLKDSENFKAIYELVNVNKKWRFDGFYNALVINEISNILKQGLGKRVHNIVPYIKEENELDNKRNNNSLIFGIHLNPECAFNVVEKGPSEDDPKSRAFREFWKGLSEFRRFDDGTVCEAVYFETRTIQEKRRIFKKIVKFIFNKKFHLKIKVVSDECEELLTSNIVAPFPTGTNEEVSLKVKAVYDDLNKKIRDLKLPLIVTSVQGTSDVFSYTDLFPPLPINHCANKKSTSIHGNSIILKEDSQLDVLPNYVAPIELVVQLGISSKWPNDLKTLQAMKTEFYFEIAKLLKEEHSIASNVKYHHVDILHEGLVFRLRLFVPKEMQLAKRSLNSEGVVVYKDSDLSLVIEREFDILPKLTGALNGIQLRYPSFGPSSALIKRWIRSQLIDESHISDTVLNLLNASLYVNSGPFNTPNLPQIGFLRFLKFLMEFDWNLNPVIVNFNDDIDSASLSEFEVSFQQNRQSYPNLYLITPYDAGKSIFTKNGPTKHILKRLKVLATEAYKYLLSSVMEWKAFQFKELFVPNLKGYDILIHLKPLLNTTHYINAHRMEVEPFSKNGSNKIPLIEFNPVQLYLRALRSMYGKFALFFHDSYGGNTIGVLWQRKAEQDVDFKVGNASGMMYVNEKLILNKDTLLNDFYITGNGIVENIEKT